MNNISLLVGERIRLYRKMKNLSLSAFSELIHKSKSTLSKYETGEISIDISTLYEIAAALDVSIFQLIHADEKHISNAHSPILGKSLHYIYIFDGRTNKILRSLLETSQHFDGSSYVTLFYNIPSFDTYEKCKSLYYGTMFEHEFVTNYSLQNQTYGIENIFMCSVKPFELSSRRIGLLSGISSRNFLPVSAKFVMSDTVLPENDELLQALMLSKEDLRLIKRFNMFIIDQMA